MVSILGIPPLTTQSMQSEVIHVDSERQGEMADKFMLEFWEKTLNFSWNDHHIAFPCRLAKILNANVSADEDYFQMHYHRNTYIAVFAVAHALHDMQECRNTSGPFLNGTCADLKQFQPWQLLFYIQKVSFIIFGHTMNFDSNGDPPAIYELISWFPHDSLKIEFLVVGSFNSSAGPDQQLSISSQSILWNGAQKKVPRSVCSEPCNPGTRKISRKGEPFCCFDCILCKDGYYSNSSDAQDCQRCSLNLWSNAQHTDCIPMPEEYLAFTDPLGIVLLSLNALGIMSTIVTGIFILCYRKLSPIWTAKGKLIGMLLLSLVACFVISVTFFGRPTHLTCQIREPLTCITLSFATTCVIAMTINMRKNAPGRHWLPTSVQHALLTLTTYRWLVLPLLFLGVLTGVCFYLAYVAGKMPTMGSEPKLITYNILFCFIVFLAFIPAYGSTQGKFAVATEIFAVEALAYGFLGCIFFPKCYNIVLKKNAM
uniref:G-protein coupled receptors family 3 profile domain-containing protein n=1 Tax=Eptatretus burgeri TaxID=7764 RepID=A0A8C4QHC0_EPTBU